MRHCRLHAVHAVAAIVAALACLPGCSPGTGELVIADVTVIDGTGAAPRPRTSLRIRGSEIVEVAPAGELSIPRGATVIDGRGLHAIPGLWDFHVHLSKSGPSALPLLVSHGITSVRDAGGDLDEIHGWRAAIERGDLLGPRIWTSGPMLESPASVERARASGSTEDFDRTRIVVHRPEEADAAIAGLVARGVDFAKIRTYADPETYLAIARAARERRLPLMGHPPWELDPLEALDAGQRTFEHGFYPYPLDEYPEDRRSELERRLAEKGTAVVPTLVSWLNQTVSVERLREILEDDAGRIDPRRRLLSARLLENWREYVVEREEEGEQEGRLEGWAGAIDRMAADLGSLHAGGAVVLAGTDLASPLVYPGSSLHEELALLVDKVGLTPLEAIHAATLGAARAMGVEGRQGTLETGRRADIVLLSADPAAAIRNSGKIVGVVLGGRYLDRAALDGMLAGVRPDPGSTSHSSIHSSDERPAAGVLGAAM